MLKTVNVGQAGKFRLGHPSLFRLLLHQKDLNHTHFRGSTHLTDRRQLKRVQSRNRFYSTLQSFHLRQKFVFCCQPHLLLLLAGSTFLIGLLGHFNQIVKPVFLDFRFSLLTFGSRVHGFKQLHLRLTTRDSRNGVFFRRQEKLLNRCHSQVFRRLFKLWQPLIDLLHSFLRIKELIHMNGLFEQLLMQMLLQV